MIHRGGNRIGHALGGVVRIPVSDRRRQRKKKNCIPRLSVGSVLLLIHSRDPRDDRSVDVGMSERVPREQTIQTRPSSARRTRRRIHPIYSPSPLQLSANHVMRNIWSE